MQDCKRMGWKSFTWMTSAGACLALTSFGCSQATPVSTQRDRGSQEEVRSNADTHLRASGLTIELKDLVHRYSHSLSRKRGDLLESIRSVIALRADALVAQADRDATVIPVLALDANTRSSMPREVRSCEEHEVKRVGVLKIYNSPGSAFHYVLEDRIGVKHLLQFGSEMNHYKTGDQVLVSGIQIPCTSMELGMKFADPIVVSSLNLKPNTTFRGETS